jgi:segregation and condensation protein B
MMYGTTHEFLQYFGLKDLASLPSLRELERELGMEGNTLLSDLEPELPGFDGPEMEQMAADYRVKKAAVEAEQKAKEEAEVQEALARELAGAEEVIEGAGDDVPEVIISGGEDAVVDMEDLAAGGDKGPRFVIDDPDEGAEEAGSGDPETEKG